MSDRGPLVLLILGTACGVLLSGAVLGWANPSLHDRWFVGIKPAQQRLEQFNDQTTQRLERLAATGVTAAAIEEHRQRLEAEAQRLEAVVQEARQAHTAKLAARAWGLLVAAVALSAIEAVSGLGTAASQRWCGALALGRYGLIAAWLAIVIPAPGVLGGISWLFVAMVAAIGTAAVVRTPNSSYTGPG